MQNAAANNSSITKFDNMLQQYYMYLPQKLLKDARELHSQCMELSVIQTTNLTYNYINKLFSFQNSIREYVGIEKLSYDLLKAFGYKKENEKKVNYLKYEKRINHKIRFLIKIILNLKQLLC